MTAMASLSVVSLLVLTVRVARKTA
jgi:hypothetical protein